MGLWIIAVPSVLFWFVVKSAWLELGAFGFVFVYVMTLLAFLHDAAISKEIGTISLSVVVLEPIA